MPQFLVLTGGDIYPDTGGMLDDKLVEKGMKYTGIKTKKS